MQIDINNINIKKRVRKNLGDVTSLMDSMRAHGLLTPIIISEKNELIAGHRRLISAKNLGWTSIDCVIINSPTDIDKLEIEIDENVHRRNFTSDELADGYTRLEKLKNPGFLRKIWAIIKSIFTKLKKLIFRK